MMKCLLRCEQENFSSCMIDTKTVPNKRFRSFIHYIERKCVGAYRIRPPWRRTHSLNDDVLIAAIVFMFAHIEGVCDTPYDFPVTQKQLYFHIVICAIISLSKMSSQMGNHHLPGVNGTFAMGNHGLKSVQKAPATCEMRTVFAQNGYRDRDGGRSPCAKGLRICRNEIVPLTKWRRQSPKRDCPLRKRSSHLPK